MTTWSAKILVLLKRKYPRPRISLDFSNPFELLVATILSAQCTDERVNGVTKDLFRRYRKMEDYGRADLEDFESAIRATGFYRNKAKNILAAARQLSEKFDRRVPETMQELLQLPGVARKTANVVLFSAFGKNEGIAVDTHVLRVSQRLKMTSHTEPGKVERDLMRIVAKKDWGLFSLRLIAHGRQTCTARKPKCQECILGQVCPSKVIFLKVHRGSKPAAPYRGED